MKKIIFISLLALGFLCLPSCSSDDKEWCTCGKNVIRTIEDVSGSMRYDGRLGRWCVLHFEQGWIDGGDYYYPFIIDKKFEKEGLEVTISGDLYEFYSDVETLAGTTYHCIDLLMVKEVE